MSALPLLSTIDVLLELLLLSPSRPGLPSAVDWGGRLATSLFSIGLVISFAMPEVA